MFTPDVPPHAETWIRKLPNIIHNEGTESPEEHMMETMFSFSDKLNLFAGVIKNPENYV